MSLPITFRPFNEEDIPFILNSWLKSWIDAPANFGVNKHIYYKTAHRYVEELLMRGGAIVACSSTNPNVIYGYICGEYYEDETVIHYIYVKKNFRGFGLATQLIDYIHQGENIPFATSFCPSSIMLDLRFEASNKLNSKDQFSLDKLKKTVRHLKVCDGEDTVCKVLINSVVYERNPKLKKKVIYTPYLIVKLATVETKPVANLVRSINE